MKRIIVVAFVLMMVFAFGVAQAVAEGQQKDKQTQSGQSSQQYGQSDTRAGAAGGSSAQSGQSPQSEQSQSGQSGQLGQKMAGQVTRASDLMDKRVKNQQGQDLGQVEDLVINQDGRIGYIIISQGGLLGVGDKYIPIPFKSAQLDQQQNQIVLNVDKQMLDSAPQISKNDWQKLSDPSFEKEVFSYYETGRSQGMQQPGGMSGQQQRGGATPGQPQRPMQQPSTGGQR